MAYTAHSSLDKGSIERSTDAGAWQAYSILHFGYVLLPLLAGFDKFFNLMTDWTKYLAPIVTSTLNVSAQTFMMAVGAIEIVAAMIVAFRPRIGGYIVAAWLAGIIVNLALNPIHYWDVAARDFGLLLGAWALGSLSSWKEHHKVSS